MHEYTLHREQLLPLSLQEAWAFFSNPHNLGRITPPDMDFRITSKELPMHIFSGMLITYSVKPMLGIPVKWVTEIKNVNAPFTFTDTQQKGPYKKWEHCHTFEAVEGGVKMVDHITYALPFGVFGQLAHWLFVRRRLEQIFDYRKKILSAQ